MSVGKDIFFHVGLSFVRKGKWPVLFILLLSRELSIQRDGAQSLLNPGVSELSIEPRNWALSRGLFVKRLSGETSDLGGTRGRKSALLFLKEGVESSAHARMAKGLPSEDSEGGARKSQHQKLRYLVLWVHG